MMGVLPNFQQPPIVTSTEAKIQPVVDTIVEEKKSEPIAEPKVEKKEEILTAQPEVEQSNDQEEPVQSDYQPSQDHNQLHE